MLKAAANIAIKTSFPAWLGSSVWLVPLCHPAVLRCFPSFPQRISSFQLKCNPLKEPLDFIKVLKWNASIFAFAT